MIRNAKVIVCPKNLETPVIEKTFSIPSFRKAIIEVTGLGFFSLAVNGIPVGDTLFKPALTDYRARDKSSWAYPLFDETTHRLYYLTYDLSEYLHAGENTLSLTLGNGWYRQTERNCEGKTYFGDSLLALFSLTVEDEDGKVMKIHSDGSETCFQNHIVYSNLFIGEVWDAAMIGRKRSPEPVTVEEPFWDILEEQTCPSDRVIRRITPKELPSKDGRRIFDAGENITGVVSLYAVGKAGTPVTLRFAEELNADGTLDFASTGAEYTSSSGKKQIQTDTCVCSGGKDFFRPEFVWHGFRYFDVVGDFEEPTVEVIHTDLPVTSHFSSSDQVLNWLYDAYIRTELDNVHTSVPSDCPHRERLGYTGDGQITARTAMLTLGAKEMYHKWITDILDSQDKSSGHVQHTAPLMGGGGGPGGWGCAVVIVPDEFYRHYGEKDMLEKCYPAMKKWVAYLDQHSENGLVTSEEKGGWCLGDWASISEMTLPEPYVNSLFFLDSLRRMEKIAAILGKDEDIPLWKEKAAGIRKAVVDTYFDPATGSFVEGRQAADAYAVWAGLDEDGRAKENLVKRYEALGYFDTGFLGTEILVDVLFRIGAEDLAFQLLSGKKEGTYGYMKAAGATTIWEYMLPHASHNHPMFGAPVRHLFENLLGVTQEASSAGYEKLLLKPSFPKGLSHAEGHVTLPIGEVKITWIKKEDGILYSADLPTPAVLLYKGQKIALPRGKSEHTL